ncbi:GNAT family N-acetyltransferase [Paenibacillus popilliae]|uniref:GNAT family N-acetyltransferase n=1 Tax=Paenibacillus popilliae TaxID=78057 RepID=A0ABY3ATY0_PAEPP|nr:GNAT family N-acetyltransferase [Paenibacillus sp. SDF0028]TQR45967.1 GNAT family N-acetyltransferase [Paenibacillus sp. SDF0028]
MNIQCKAYHEGYYNEVCQFLIDISQEHRKHINWNWVRWEWMYFHPDFNRSLRSKIGLWFDNLDLVGLATYDYDLGEAFFATKQGYEELEDEIIEYAVNNFSDENGLGIAVNDTDAERSQRLQNKGFVKHDQCENILVLTIANIDHHSVLPAGITLKSLDAETDVYKHETVLWKGFDHDGPVPIDEVTIQKQKAMLSAIHMNPSLHIAAVVVEALKRCSVLGANKAYVISDHPFYKAIGFVQHSRYSFYWHND